LSVSVCVGLWLINYPYPFLLKALLGKKNLENESSFLWGGAPIGKAISANLKTGVPWVNQDKKTGLIVPPRDPEAIAQASNALLKTLP